DRIDHAEQHGEQRLPQKIEDGQEIVDAFGQSVLEVGWTDAAYGEIGRYDVRAGEQLEVFHNAFLGNLLRCSIWDYCVCVHGAIVLRDRIRDKDKDPSFSAKQTFVKD